VQPVFSTALGSGITRSKTELIAIFRSSGFTDGRRFHSSLLCEVSPKMCLFRVVCRVPFFFLFLLER